MTGIWEHFLAIVKDEVGSRVVETWFKSVSLYKWDVIEKTVYLRAPNIFVQDWIKSNYVPVIQLHLGRLLNVESPKIIFVDDTVEQQLTQKTAASLVITQARTEIPSIHSIDSFKSAERFNRTYSFNTFVVGPSNSLAYAAAHAVTEKPGELYNPLFIYGGSGLGKTHLLHSIGNTLRANNKQFIVLYQTTDRFVNEFINAIRFNKMHKFNAKYKNVDALLLDDVQFISNKEQTQEAFFHIFNALHEERKQIVLSSDVVPQQIAGLAERLHSRLAWGLVADIYQPSLETKIAIVKKKAEQSNEPISDEVAQYIASTTVSNIRELEGALIRVIAFASLTKQPVSLQLAEKVLVRSHVKQQEMQTDFEGVIKCLGSYYRYSLADLRSKSRNKELSFVRQVAMFLMKKVTNKSLRDIGDYLGGRDHSTVMHAISKIEEYAKVRPDFEQQLKKMEFDSAR